MLHSPRPGNVWRRKPWKELWLHSTVFKTFFVFYVVIKCKSCQRKLKEWRSNFPDISHRDTLCCYSLFQKEQQGKHLFYSAEEQLRVLDLCTKAALICYEIHKQRIEVLCEMLFQSSSSALLFCCCNHISIYLMLPTWKAFGMYGFEYFYLTLH